MEIRSRPARFCSKDFQKPSGSKVRQAARFTNRYRLKPSAERRQRVAALSSACRNLPPDILQNSLYTTAIPDTFFPATNTNMRIAILLSTVAAAVLFTGCAGPESKLGRGISNMTEFARLGEISRSMEQTAVWDGPETTATTGFLRGLNRSFARTGIGIYEVVTFPLPPYKPLFAPTSPMYPDPSITTVGNKSWGGLRLPEKPVSPSTYKASPPSGTAFEPDSLLGFSSGDPFPFAPGSRFRTFAK
jgi:putative exosortase-associated protein (TIGR04073 family)